MNSHKLKIIEGIFLVLTIFLSHILLSTPTELINSTGSSTLLNIVYIGGITLIFFLIVYKIFSLFPGSSIIDICEFLGGKTLKFIYCIIFIIYILTLTSVMISLFAESLSLIYFSHLDITFIILAIIVSIGILNILGFKTICRLNIILVPCMILSLIFLYFASLEKFTFERIFPILGYGLDKTFIDGISNIFSFSGIYILFFIFPLLTNISDFKKIGLSSISFYTIILFFTVSALLFSIPQIANSQTPLSLYLLARQIRLGDYIQSIDALFLLLWIPFLILYLAINMHFSLKSFQKLTNIKYSSGMIYSFCAIIFIICLLLTRISEFYTLSTVIYKYLSIFLVFILNFVILILACIKKLLIKFLRKRSALL